MVLQVNVFANRIEYLSKSLEELSVFAIIERFSVLFQVGYVSNHGKHVWGVDDLLLEHLSFLSNEGHDDCVKDKLLVVHKFSAGESSD